MTSPFSTFLTSSDWMPMRLSAPMEAFFTLRSGRVNVRLGVFASWWLIAALPPIPSKVIESVSHPASGTANTRNAAACAARLAWVTACFMMPPR
jgi:hypothetical protein